MQYGGYGADEIRPARARRDPRIRATREATDAELLADVIRVAHILGRAPKPSEYDRHGKYVYKMVAPRATPEGTWAALRGAVQARFLSDHLTLPESVRNLFVHEGLRQYLARVALAAINAALASTGNNLSEAAKLLNTDRNSLRDRLETAQKTLGETNKAAPRAPARPAWQVPRPPAGPPAGAPTPAQS
jgi:hypothetical protein